MSQKVYNIIKKYKLKPQCDNSVHEKVFNITNHQGDANQNHNVISPHSC